MSAQQLFAQVHRLSAEIDGRLAAVASAQPAARTLATSLARDLQRHADERRRVEPRLGVTRPVPSAPAGVDATLAGLRGAQETLMLAYADGLSALRHDPAAVRLLAGHMVDVARHLTITDLWIAEGSRG